MTALYFAASASRTEDKLNNINKERSAWGALFYCAKTPGFVWGQHGITGVGLAVPMPRGSLFTQSYWAYFYEYIVHKLKKRTVLAAYFPCRSNSVPLFQLVDYNKVKALQTNIYTDKTALGGDIVAPLLMWYSQNARALPWRENTDPYRVWVSEIMLQQTQVDTVIPYYNRFLQQLPTIKALADADEPQLLKLWEGLGYYSRVRNLQKAARMIMQQHDGRFPTEPADLLALPGVGAYTAGAIASICFEQPTPAVDGNVLRVVARLTGSDADIALPQVKNGITNLLRAVYPKQHCGDFTQSLMELGATVCLPNGAPKCDDCPVRGCCRAYAGGTQRMLPVKSRKKPRRREEKTVFLLRCENKLAIRRRAEGGLLGGLWELPHTEGCLLPEEAAQALGEWGFSDLSAGNIRAGRCKKHVFTHLEWSMTSFIVVCKNMPEAFIWVTRHELESDIAIPSAFAPFLEDVLL